MRRTRVLAGVSSLAVTATALAAFTPTATAEPGSPSAAPGATTGGVDADTEGRGPTPQASAARQATAAQAELAEQTAALGGPIAMPTSYPFQPTLRTYPAGSPDASDTGDLVRYDEIAPQLQRWMAGSDRISTQVVGQSTNDRDLYLVTVTAPETAAQTAQQTRWRNAIKKDPAAAAADSALAAGYKKPIWFSANIHGNEWEGTDAAMKYIDELLADTSPATRTMLENHRIYFSLSLNPDGRVAGTRATRLTLDPNRDMITSKTPESVSYVRTAAAIQPLYAADFHGYTAVLQVEPCGPPHGENYEYDLLIPHGYAMARAVEDAVVAADIPGNMYYDQTTGQAVPVNTGKIKIPYRDTPSGWDDYPPIFTAQYAAFHGAVSNTVELPLRRPNSSSQSVAAGTVNTAVALETISAMTDYFTANSSALLANQVEMFRRGVAGAPKTALTVSNKDAVPGPSEWKPLWDVADDQDPVTLPRAYVIPVGDGQRSAGDARNLVRNLLFHGIEVGRLTSATSVGGTTYPAGSYVVDMHQPLRGLANSLLDLGSDISAKVPTMYDISAWSWSYLWGATVAKVGATTDAAPVGATTPVTAPTSNASVPAKPRYTTFEPAGVGEFQALNSLLERGVAVSLLADGTAVVGPDRPGAVSRVSRLFDVAFTRATRAELDALDDAGTKGLRDLTIAYTGTQDDKLALAELGFDDLVAVTATDLTEDRSMLDEADVLWIGSDLAFGPTTAGGRATVQEFVDRGGSVVGRGVAGSNVATGFGILSATPVEGNRDGNGIVAVEPTAGSPLAPYAQRSSFIYPATWFTGLGSGTQAAERYAAGNPLLAGHWRRGTGTGGAVVANGPTDAAGQASAIFGQAASGARGFVFGTSVFFRTHPKGPMSQAARALFWASPAGTKVLGPGDTSVTVAPVKAVRYPGTVKVRVRTASADGAVDGRVQLLRGDEVVATGRTTGGVATLTVAGLKPGSRSLVARFTPKDASYDSSTSGPFTVRVEKARSTTDLKVTEVGRARVGLRLALRVADLPDVGKVVISEGGKVLRTVRLTAADKGVERLTLTLRRGQHRLVAAFAGSRRVEDSSDAVRFRTR